MTLCAEIHAITTEQVALRGTWALGPRFCRALHARVGPAHGCRRPARRRDCGQNEGSVWGGSTEPIFSACSTIHTRERMRGVTPVRPRQPSLNDGPVDQLTTPMTASAPPISR